MKLANKNAIPEAIKPVSYTHLDVYKRQGENILAKRYEKIDYIDNKTSLVPYLNPNRGQIARRRELSLIHIYCNAVAVLLQNLYGGCVPAFPGPDHVQRFRPCPV